MKTLATEISIDATPQTVWSVMDDLSRYPEWNGLVPDLRGRTTAGETLLGTLVQEGTGDIPLSPTLTRVVGAREFRWLSVIPGDEGFHADHYFILTPTAEGGTHFRHNESFWGPGGDATYEHASTFGTIAYNKFNADLKARAEMLKDQPVSLHPVVDSPQGSGASHASTEVKLGCPLRISSGRGNAVRTDHSQPPVRLQQVLEA